jgi:hypothetical protein
MILTQRLFALREQYAAAKRQHREREPLAKEMAYIVVKLLKRENAQDRRLARNAGN